MVFYMDFIYFPQIRSVIHVNLRGLHMKTVHTEEQAKTGDLKPCTLYLTK